MRPRASRPRPPTPRRGPAPRARRRGPAHRYSRFVCRTFASGSLLSPAAGPWLMVPGPGAPPAHRPPPPAARAAVPGRGRRSRRRRPRSAAIAVRRPPAPAPPPPPPAKSRDGGGAHAGRGRGAPSLAGLPAPPGSCRDCARAARPRPGAGALFRERRGGGAAAGRVAARCPARAPLRPPVEPRSGIARLPFPRRLNKHKNACDSGLSGASTSPETSGRASACRTPAALRAHGRERSGRRPARSEPQRP